MSPDLVIVTNPKVINTDILNSIFEGSSRIQYRFGTFRDSLEEFSRELDKD